MAINHLPDEILRKVLFQLPVEERIFSASRVCKRWKFLMPYEDFNEIRIESFHESICRSGSWCNFRLAGKDKQQIKLWLKRFLKSVLPAYGYYLKCIDFNFVKHNIYRLIIDSEIMQIVWDNCPVIENLNLLNCDLSLDSLPVLTKFPFLKQLSVVDDWKFEIAGIWKTLNLTHFDSHMSRPFGNVTNPEHLVSIKTDIGSNFFLNLNLFCARYTNIEELYIKNCRWVSPENFSLISRLIKLRVLHLELQDDLLNSVEINDICQGCRLIEDLSISYLQPNTGDNLNLTPLKSLSNLRKLFFNAEHVYGTQLAIIANLKQLKSLEIFCTTFLSLDTFDEESSTQWPDLECVTIFSNDVQTSLDDCSFVYNLFLRNSSSILKIAGFSTSFDKYANIDAKVLNNYFYRFSKSNTLTNTKIWFDNADELNEFFAEKLVLHKLKVLHITSGASLNFTQQAAICLSKCCPNLEQLVLNQSVEISVEVATILLKSCRNLTHFKVLAKTVQLPSEELMYVIGAHTKLKHFEFPYLLPAYHLKHFENIILGRKEINEEGHQLHPLYIEANGTFYLPKDFLFQLKSLLICFTNVFLIETKFHRLLG